MTNRRNFYYGQLVTQGEINDAFDQFELAEQQALTDLGASGVVNGMVVSQNTVPDLSVLITSGVAYDSLGQRVANPSTVNLDVSVDSNAVSTAVINPGNEKWVSVFAVYDVALSDLRPTLGGGSVYWRADASIAWVVVQGAEAGVGLAARPSLISGYVLVADFRLEFGDVSVLNARIDPNPLLAVDPDTRKDFFVELTTSLPIQIVAGTPSAATQLVLDGLNGHVAGAMYRHDAEDIGFDPTGTNYDAGDTDVEAALLAVPTLVAPYPGNLSFSPDRRRTHGASADWRDAAYIQKFTFADLAVVPGGGGDVDLVVAGILVGDGLAGLIELEDTAMYLVNVTFGFTTEDSTDPNYTYASLVWIGHWRRVGGSVTVLSPSANATISVPGGNAVVSVVATPAPVGIVIRTTCAAALAGYNTRLTADINVQRTLLLA